MRKALFLVLAPFLFFSYSPESRSDQETPCISRLYKLRDMQGKKLSTKTKKNKKLALMARGVAEKLLPEKMKSRKLNISLLKNKIKRKVIVTEKKGEEEVEKIEYKSKDIHVSNYEDIKGARVTLFYDETEESMSYLFDSEDRKKSRCIDLDVVHE
jgi:hypothetical protein